MAGMLRLGGRLPWDQAKARGQIEQALAAAGPELRKLPVAAFPAVAYAALARAYAKGSAPSELSKRVRLTWAVACGRL